MSDTNQALLDRIADLQDRLSKASGEAGKWRKELRAEQAARKQLETDAAALTADRDTWKAKAESSPTEWKAKAEDLQAKLHARDSRDAWNAVVGDTLASKVTLEKLWGEIGYTPGEAVPSPEEIAEQLKGARDSVPFLFKPADATSATKPAVKPPLRESIDAGGRGAPDKNASRVTVRKSQLQDPVWKLDKHNSQMLNDAAKAGVLDIIDG